MSFLESIFGLFSKAPTVEAKQESLDYEGYLVVATPAKEGGQYRLSGIISKEIDGQRKEHKLIRADLFPTQEDCARFTLTKAKQVIKEQGDNIFK